MEFYGVDQVYSESGVDLTLLRENLSKPLEYRLEKNSRALRSMRAFARECQKPSAATRDQHMDLLEVEAILKQLTSYGVRFVLIGGLAMRAHGSAHITEDADFCYDRSPQNIAALADALAPIHPYMRGAPKGLPFSFDAPTIAGCNFTLETDLGEIDFLGYVSGLGEYSDVASHSEEKNVFGATIKVLSLDGLITAKKAAGRTRDKLHLLELEELKKLKDSPGTPS